MSTPHLAPIPHLYLLDFDHWHLSEHSLLRLSVPPTPDEADGIRRMKSLIYTGFRLVFDGGVERNGVGILVDGQYGADVARCAIEDGILLAMHVEKLDRNGLDMEYGSNIGEHIDMFDPAFAQVQVRYNPEGDPKENARQTERLARLTDWLRWHGRRFLLELRVPATQAQLDAISGDLDRYDGELRPSLTVRAMSELQTGGVDPDVWKIEGMDRPLDCLRVARQARSGGRDHVSCVVLDRHVSWDRLEHWLKVAASTPGFIGFSLSTTLWWNPIQDLRNHQLTEAEAALRISENYRRALIVWEKAALCSGYGFQVEASPS